ncbi:MAG: molybdenum transporter [Proteobacteria bacterium]|nr:MAG: molybdenum transporter [Pseudomonadota bacterium]
MNVKVKIWIEDNNQDLIFGSGKTEVLKYIDQTGSISQAARRVGMNYKKAWNHIQILQKHIEDDLVFTQKGRGENSGSTLSPKAREIIQTYEILEYDIKKYAQNRFNELFLTDDKYIINAKAN